MYIDLNTIVAVAGGITAMGVIGGVLIGLYRFWQRPKIQEREIQELKRTHEEDIKKINEEPVSYTHLITGTLYSEIKTSAQVMAVPGDGRSKQVFRIYKISKPINGVITVSAEHISYQLSYIPVAPFQASSVPQALQGMKSNAAENCPFDFWTDKTTAAKFAVEEPASIRSILGGVRGSVLDVYGGEYEFDMYTVRLHNQRGQNRGVTLRYGKNITDLQQEENISNTITGIYPYWKDSEGNVVQLAGKIISAENAKNYPYPRTIPYDFSDDFEEVPTETELRSAAENYINTSGIGVPSVNISVSFVALWQTEEYKEIAPLERVQLCDTVTVQFEALGVSATAKVNKTVWDVLKERYENIELGDAKSNLTTEIIKQEQEIKQKPSESFLQDAVSNATNWITNGRGYMMGIKDADGNWMELCSLDQKDINKAMNVWRWNNGGFGHSKTGYNGPFTTAITQDGKMVADFITVGNLMANLIKVGVLSDQSGNFYLDMKTGELKMKNGSFTGEITSESGKIGPFSIRKNELIIYNSEGEIVATFTLQGNNSSYPGKVSLELKGGPMTCEDLSVKRNATITNINRIGESLGMTTFNGTKAPGEYLTVRNGLIVNG